MRSLSITVVVFACILAFVWWWNRPQPMPVQLYEVERGPVETLVANTRAGTLKSCRRSRLSFNIGGQVSELLVEEGQSVKEGQVLMRLR
ncbi:biotin/lipoyl-binding protein, partial [Pseudomonas sp. CrR25]|nr:biotin/lipoyl-binding protein [Pseudomonas sp. CrR25]